MARNEKNNIDTTVTMESAITYLGLQHEFEIVSDNKYYTCPVCGGKKKLNINFKKGNYNCVICEFGGGPINFWAHFRGFGKDTSAAGKDYSKFVKDMHSTGEVIKVKIPPAPQVKEFDIASIEERHLAYNSLLEMLNLSVKHREDLIKRGLTDIEISRGGYKTAPETSTNAICHSLMSKGIALEGVPGFYKENGEWKFVNYGSGFLIPSRNINGQIQGLQIRRDVVKKNGTRYLTISSAGKDNGTQGHTYPHINIGNGDFKKIIITEGPLKGDIISRYTGFPCVAILGVNARATLPEVLKDLKSRGTRQICIAFDMDLYSNKHVQNALLQLKKQIVSIGFRFNQGDWNKEFKGLDDYLHAKTQQKNETF